MFVREAGVKGLAHRIRNRSLQFRDAMRCRRTAAPRARDSGQGCPEDPDRVQEFALPIQLLPDYLPIHASLRA